MESSVLDKEISVHSDYAPMVVRFHPVIEMSDDQLYEFAAINRDLRIERNAQGELIFMTPTGGETSDRNAEITAQVRVWSKKDGTGVSFDSSGGFRLPNGAMRSPDASWIMKSRLATLSDKQRKKFIPLCPDFIIELQSPTDSLSLLKAKMQEYLDNGLRLGLLLNPEQRRVYIYRPETPIEELDNPETVSGEPVLPGFVLDLREIW